MTWEDILKDDTLEVYEEYIMDMSYGIEDIDDLANFLEKEGKFKTAVEGNEIGLATRDNKLMGTIEVLELNEGTRDFNIIASAEERKNIRNFLKNTFSSQEMEDEKRQEEENKENYKEVLEIIEELRSMKSRLEREMDMTLDEQIPLKEMSEVVDLLNRALAELGGYY
tara:strand:+ start:1907 stop:2410 length:504 start_codon:yes stop_codon:yes gene_type:complete